jgi:hypothetical protein
MKKVLGSLLLLTLGLWAKSGYEWKVDISEKELYLHQAVTLFMECTFDEKGKNDDVNFAPPADIPFGFELLSETTHFEEGKKILQYRYVLFAKEAGEFVLELSPRMLFTTQSAIDNVIVGRDNVNELEVQREIVKLEPIRLRVKQTASEFTGKLSLQTRQDIQTASAYEPVHLEIEIEGEGNLHKLEPISFEIEGVEVFSDTPEIKIQLSEAGYRGKWIQRFAFVGHEDFVIPSVSLSYFDLVSKEEKVLKSEAFSIKIASEGIKREELIDQVNLPSTSIELKDYLAYLYYLLSFIFGFVAAKLLKFPQRTQKKQKGEKIKAAGSAKELLDVLIIYEKDLFSSEIDALESAVYKGNAVRLAEIKKQALSRL